MSNNAQPYEAPLEEQTFFIRGHQANGPQAALTFILRAPCAQDAKDALLARGYVANSLTPVIAPTEEGFRVRTEGTFVVAASHQQATLRLYGPFNDQSDASRWIGVKEQHARDPGVVYMPIEPDHCFRVVRVDGVARILEYPPDFFASPL